MCHFGISLVQNVIVSRTSRSDGRGGKMNSFCAWYSFRMSFCSVPPIRARAHTRRFGVGDEHREHDRGGAVDRHRRRDRAEVDAAVEVLDVGERVDRDAAPADLAERELVVGVAAHQRRQVERGRESVAAGGEQLVEAAVRVDRGAEARRTSASSRASTGTSTRTDPAGTGTGPGTRRRPGRTPDRPARPTSWRSRPCDVVRRRSPLANVPGWSSRLHDRACTADRREATYSPISSVTPWSRPAV